MCWFKYRENFFLNYFLKSLKFLSFEFHVNVGEAAFYVAASSSLLIILWSFFPWYFWCLLNSTACQWLAGCLQQVLIQLFQCRSWSSKGSIGRWLFTGKRKKTLRKETVSNYLVAACETIFCNEVLNLCKFSSLVMRQKLEHIWEDPAWRREQRMDTLMRKGNSCLGLCSQQVMAFSSLSHIQISAHIIWLRILHKAKYFDW